jgi:hypothetical protein
MRSRRIVSALFATVLAWSAEVLASEGLDSVPGAGRTMLPSTTHATFVPNAGQWDESVRFGLIHGAGGAWAEEDGFALSCESAGSAEVVVARFAAARKVAPRGFDATDARFHFFLGNDPSQWRTDLRGYRSVEWRDVWPDVDVLLHVRPSGVEYDVVLRPGADVSRVRIEFEGAESVRVLGSGAVEVGVRSARITQSAPQAYVAELDGTRRSIPARFEQVGPNSVVLRGLEAPDRPIVVDPGVEWSTYLGGNTPMPGASSTPDEFTAVEVCDDGSVIVVGRTGFIDYPTTPGVAQPTITPPSFVNGPGIDGVISRLSADGSSLVFSTFLGGKGGEFLFDLALRTDETIAIGGFTSSSDFPVTPGAYQVSFPTAVLGPGFVTVLSNSGSQIIASTFLSGWTQQGNESIVAIGVAPDGSIAAGGHTFSLDFPVTPGAFDPVHSSPSNFEGFVTVFDPSLSSLVYSTYLGGSHSDRVIDLEVDELGYATATGQSHSPNFPVTPNAIGSTATQGQVVAFAARFGPDGTPVYSTYLNHNGMGGSIAHGHAVDAVGRVTVTGTSTSDFPVTPGAWLTNCFGNCVFAARLTPQGAIEWGTFLGGFGLVPADVQIDSLGGAVLGIYGTGGLSYPFPPGAFDPIAQLDESMVLRVDAHGKSVYYGTMLGGSQGDASTWTYHPIALDDSDSAVFVGTTSSADFPISTGAFATAMMGLSDGFVTKLDLLPLGVSKFGVATKGCLGKPVIGLTAMPAVGKKLRITCGRAPAGASGFLLLGERALVTPSVVLGAGIYVDLGQPFALVPVIAGMDGTLEVGFAVPSVASISGLRRFAQFVFRDPCRPAGMSASNALDLTVQD